MITCRSCKEDKPRSEYHDQPTSKRGHCLDCKDCRREYNKNRRTGPKRQEILDKKKAHHKFYRETAIDRYREKRFGLTREDYDSLLKEQEGGCAICKSTNPKGRYKERFSVDHCHETGQVRGLLCNTCNLGIGHMKDDPNLLRAAIAYLEASR